MGSTALDLLLLLEMYEDAAVVYARRGQETKAVVLLKNELNSTEKELSEICQINYNCCLGDITMESNYYLTALEIAKNDKKLPKSRILKSLGYLYYKHPKLKNNEKALYYFMESVKISPLDMNIWFCIGCIGLNTQKFDIAINAFRRSTLLNWDNFQAWGNLAAAFSKSNKPENKYHAFIALKEALKCEHNNVKLWENYLTMSMDIGEFIEVVRAYDRILDIEKKYTDLKVLGVLVENYDRDNVQKISKSKVVELIKRVIASDPSNYQVWYMLGWLIGFEGSVNENCEAIEAYVKSFRSLQQSLNFPKNHQELSKAKDLIFTIKKYLSDDDYYQKHNSITTGLSALKSICESQLLIIDDDTELANVCKSILNDL